MESAVRDELDRLLHHAAEVRRSAAEQPDAAQIVDGGRGYIGGALATMSRFALLSDDEAHEWGERLMRELPPSDWMEPPSGGALTG